MRNRSKIFMVAIICIAGLVPTVSCQTEGPKQVVEQFGEALEKKDNKALIPFITNEPDYVAKKAHEEFLRIYPQVKRPDASQKDQELAPETHAITKGAPKFQDEDLVTSIVSTDLLFTQNRTITKVVSIRESGDEALAKVELEGRDSLNGNRYAALIYDVLLHREKGEWKIFKMIARHEYDEEWYQYNFYANPDWKPPQS
jgi:hypothetical protein